MKTLKRILGLGAMFLLFATMVNAQFSLGIRGGVHFAKADYGDEVEYNDDREFLVGPQAALMFEWRIADYFALQAEPGYIQKGEKLHFGEAGPDDQGHITTLDAYLRTRLHYLTLPVLAKGIVGSDNFRFYAIGGPEVGYAVSGRYETEFTMTNGQEITENAEGDIDFEEDGIDRFDVGLIFGAGVEAKIGLGSIVLDGRYNLGLYDIDRDKGSEGETFNRGFGFNLGYLMPIGQ